LPLYSIRPVPGQPPYDDAAHVIDNDESAQTNMLGQDDSSF